MLTMFIPHQCVHFNIALCHKYYSNPLECYLRGGKNWLGQNTCPTAGVVAGNSRLDHHILAGSGESRIGGKPVVFCQWELL